MPDGTLSTASLYAILGVFGGMLIGFYGLIRYILGQSAKDRQDLTAAITHMAKSSEKVATTTERGFAKLTQSSDRTADEARLRNGHLGELIAESSKTNQQLADNATATIVTALQTVGTQKVEHQIIKEQVTK